MTTKILKIEWQHLEVNGETCDLCEDTGAALKTEVAQLNKGLNPQGYAIEMVETRLNESQIARSNSLLFNNSPIEDIIDLKIVLQYCESCSELTGSEAACRTVVYRGKACSDIPAAAIREAAYKALNLPGSEQGTGENGLDCECSCKGCS